MCLTYGPDQPLPTVPSTSSFGQVRIDPLRPHQTRITAHVWEIEKAPEVRRCCSAEGFPWF